MEEEAWEEDATTMGWACDKCTFINAFGTRQCAVCEYCCPSPLLLAVFVLPHPTHLARAMQGGPHHQYRRRRAAAAPRAGSHRARTKLRRLWAACLPPRASCPRHGAWWATQPTGPKRKTKKRSGSLCCRRGRKRRRTLRQRQSSCVRDDNRQPEASTRGPTCPTKLRHRPLFRLRSIFQLLYVFSVIAFYSLFTLFWGGGRWPFCRGCRCVMWARAPVSATTCTPSPRCAHHHQHQHTLGFTTFLELMANPVLAGGGVLQLLPRPPGTVAVEYARSSSVGRLRGPALARHCQ
jgi:hypothetical protein